MTGRDSLIPPSKYLLHMRHVSGTVLHTEDEIAKATQSPLLAITWNCDSLLSREGILCHELVFLSPGEQGRDV